MPLRLPFDAMPTPRSLPPRRPPRDPRPRRRARALTVSVLALVALAGAACAAEPVPTGPTPAPSVDASATPGASATPSPALTPVPDGASPTPDPEPTATTTTETDWGTILDALPAGFPVFPGANPAPPMDGAATAAFSVGAAPVEITEWYQSALEMAGYSTVALSGPFEDGSTVIDSVGPGDGSCRAMTTITPLSGTTFVTVLVDAACATT